MKKILTIAAAAAMAVMLLAGCSGKSGATPACAPVVENIISTVGIEEMAVKDADSISSYLDVDMATVEEFSLYVCGNGGFADEVGMFRMKSAEDAKTLKKLIDERIQKRMEVFESYNPDEYDKLGSATVIVKGNYVFYVVSDDNAAAEKIFLDSLK